MKINLARRSQKFICIVAMLGTLRWGIIIVYGLSKHGIGSWPLGEILECGHNIVIAMFAGLSIYWLQEPKKNSD